MAALLEQHVPNEAGSVARRGVFATLTAAFAADPAARWMYPEPEQYDRHFPAFAEAFGGGALDCGTADYSDGLVGVALWLPPGVGPDEDTLIPLLQDTVRPADQDQVFAVFEAMGRFHPHEPHWYLPLIGVRPAHQGRGHGSALMQQALRRCDEEGRLAYLESSNPANVPLYERHGFEVLGVIRAGSSPPLFPMLRRPRATA